MSNHRDESTPSGNEIANEEATDNQHRITQSNKAFQNNVNDKLELAICKYFPLSKRLTRMKAILQRQMQELVEVTDDYKLLQMD